MIRLVRIRDFRGLKALVEVTGLIQDSNVYGKLQPRLGGTSGAGWRRTFVFCRGDEEQSF